MVFVSISDDLNHIYLFHFLPGRDGDGDGGEQITRKRKKKRKNVEEIEMKSNESHSTLMHFSCSTLSSFTLPVIRYTEVKEGELKITLNSWYTRQSGGVSNRKKCLAIPCTCLVSDTDGRDCVWSCRVPAATSTHVCNGKGWRRGHRLSTSMAPNLSNSRSLHPPNRQHVVANRSSKSTAADQAIHRKLTKNEIFILCKKEWDFSLFSFLKYHSSVCGTNELSENRQEKL